MMAVGHRRSRRAASLTAAEHGADPEVGRARPRRTASVLVIDEVVLLIHLAHPCRDHGSLRGRYE